MDKKKDEKRDQCDEDATCVVEWISWPDRVGLLALVEQRVANCWHGEYAGYHIQPGVGPFMTNMWYARIHWRTGTGSEHAAVSMEQAVHNMETVLYG